MKVKVGPVVAEYTGTATVVEMDDVNRTVKLTASGRDKRGAGNASADIFAEMTEVDGGTNVSIATDLKVSGKVAQFGRGVMGDISKKLLGRVSDKNGVGIRLLLKALRNIHIISNHGIIAPVMH